MATNPNITAAWEAEQEAIRKRLEARLAAQKTAQQPSPTQAIADMEQDLISQRTPTDSSPATTYNQIMAQKQANATAIGNVSEMKAPKNVAVNQPPASTQMSQSVPAPAAPASSSYLSGNNVGYDANKNVYYDTATMQPVSTTDIDPQIAQYKRLYTEAELAGNTEGMVANAKAADERRKALGQAENNAELLNRLMSNVSTSKDTQIPVATAVQLPTTTSAQTPAQAPVQTPVQASEPISTQAHAQVPAVQTPVNTQVPAQVPVQEEYKVVIPQKPAAQTPANTQVPAQEEYKVEVPQAQASTQAQVSSPAEKASAGGLSTVQDTKKWLEDSLNSVLNNNTTSYMDQAASITQIMQDIVGGNYTPKDIPEVLSWTEALDQARAQLDPIYAQKKENIEKDLKMMGVKSGLINQLPWMMFQAQNLSTLENERATQTADMANAIIDRSSSEKARVSVEEQQRQRDMAEMLITAFNTVKGSDTEKLDIVSQWLNTLESLEMSDIQKQSAKYDLQLRAIDTANYPEELRLKIATAQQALNEAKSDDDYQVAARQAQLAILGAQVQTALVDAANYPEELRLKIATAQQALNEAKSDDEYQVAMRKLDVVIKEAQANMTSYDAKNYDALQDMSKQLAEAQLSITKSQATTAKVDADNYLTEKANDLRAQALTLADKTDEASYNKKIREFQLDIKEIESNMLKEDWENYPKEAKAKLDSAIAAAKIATSNSDWTEIANETAAAIDALNLYSTKQKIEAGVTGTESGNYSTYEKELWDRLTPKYNSSTGEQLPGPDTNQVMAWLVGLANGGRITTPEFDALVQQVPGYAQWLGISNKPQVDTGITGR